MRALFCFCLMTVAEVSICVARTIKVSVKTHYGPSSFKANVGDEVQVHFTTGNKSFTQSTFDQPCVPLPGGIDSGFVNIPPGGTPQYFNFTLTSTAPIWFFNQQTIPQDACAAGFIGVINPTSNQPVSHFRSKVTNLDLLVSITATDSAAAADSTTAADPTTATDSTTAADSSATSALPSLPSSIIFIPSTLTTGTSPSPGLAGLQTAALQPTLSTSTTSPESTVGSSVVPIASASQLATSSGDNISSDRLKYVIIVFSVLLSFMGLSASLIAVVAYRRGRRSAIASSLRGDPGFGGTPPTRRTRALQLIANIRTRANAVSFRPPFGWNRLDESGATKINPYEPPERSVVFEGKNHKSVESDSVRYDAASEVTLVARPMASSGRSVSVQVSESTSDKGITEYLGITKV